MRPLCILVALLMFLFATIRYARAEEPALNTTEAAMVKHLNDFRARNGLPALKPAGWLMERARMHTRWMLSHGMIHSQGIAENIAYGQPSPAAVTNTWANSRGHRANMLGAHVYVGVAGYTSPSGAPYWTQQFSTSATGSPVAVEGGGGSSGLGRVVGLPRRIFGRFRR